MTTDTLAHVDNLESEDELERAQAAQSLINTGLAWNLQGYVGRSCMSLIEAGHCMTGTVNRKDYWGNVVPARDVVADGTKGSRGFVVERQGEDWAKAIEAVEG